MMEQRPLVSLNDAAKASGKSYYEVYNLIASGRLTRVKQGSRVFVRAAELRAYMDDPKFSARREGAASPIFWRGIEYIPDDRRDGRDVLLWVDGHSAICSWCDGWRDPVGRIVRGATHYADVEGPGA